MSGIEESGSYRELPSGSTDLDTGTRLVSQDDGSVWKVVGYDDYDDLPIILKVGQGFNCDGCHEWKDGEPAEETSVHGGAEVLLVCEDCRDRDRIRELSTGSDRP